MKELTCDIAVIGAGAAGLSAASAAASCGADTVVIDREEAPGGVLLQCIHNGFGLHYFKEELTGPEYASRMALAARKAQVRMLAGHTAVSITPGIRGHELILYSGKTGVTRLSAGAVILATGCRERTRANISVSGDRPAGVFTAGLAQKLVNIDGVAPGKRAVIVGSGDIGLIMARRLTFQGAKVLACIEIMKKSSGLMRNVVQCLNDYDIPLLLHHTVTDVEGREHVTGVKVSQVDDNLKPIPGTEIHFDCDTLMLSCGLIPENELTRAMGIEIDPKTRGPKVDSNMATSMPGVFAGGNVVKVYDLVDWVSRDSEIAGRSAAAYAIAVKA